MKKLLSMALIVFQLLTLCAVAENASDADALNAQIEALTAENEALRAQIDRLNERIPAYANPITVAVFDGGFVTFDEIYDDYQMILEVMSIFGEDFESDPNSVRDIQKSLIDEKIAFKLLTLHAEETGGPLLTEEEETSFLAEARRAYAEILEEISRDDAGDAMSDIYSEEEFVSIQLDEIRMTNAIERLSRDVTVSEDEIRAFYDEKLSADKEYYTEYPDEYAFLAPTEMSLWIPEGYRVARAILVSFTEEQQTAYDNLLLKSYDAEDEETLLELDAQMEAILSELLPEAEAVAARLNAGESFDSVRSEFAENAVKLGEMGTLEGGLVNAGSWDIAAEAVLALTKPGQITAPVPCNYGFVIAEYREDVASRALSFEETAEEMERLALQEKQTAYVDALILEWMEKSHVDYLLDRLNG